MKKVYVVRISFFAADFFYEFVVPFFPCHCEQTPDKPGVAEKLTRVCGIKATQYLVEDTYQSFKVLLSGRF